MTWRLTCYLGPCREQFFEVAKAQAQKDFQEDPTNAHVGACSSGHMHAILAEIMLLLLSGHMARGALHA